MTDPASVLVLTAALLAVALLACAYGSLRSDVRELRSDVEELKRQRGQDAEETRRAHAKNRAAMMVLRLALRRVRRMLRLLGAEPPEEDPEPDPIGFRRRP